MDKMLSDCSNNLKIISENKKIKDKLFQ